MSPEIRSGARRRHLNRWWRYNVEYPFVHFVAWVAFPFRHPVMWWLCRRLQLHYALPEVFPYPKLPATSRIRL